MGVGAAALLATFEASAIGGLIVGALVGVWLARRALRARPMRRVETIDTLVLGALGVGIVLYLFAMFWTDPPLVPDDALTTHLVTRRDLWQEALTMIGDYPFTGSGLAGSAMVMSSYVWLRHVPYHPHVHNLFLQVALQQGIPAMVGLLGMFLAGGWVVIATARASERWVRRVQPFVAAPAAALVTLGCAGLFESDLSGSFLISCTLLPFGLTFGLGFAALTNQRSGPAPRARLPILAGLAPLAVILMTALWPGARARLQSNLGAILQTQAELRAYRWPEWSIQDQLRRGHVVDLEPAIRHYHAALAIDPRNSTAHRRLGQIDLSRGRTEQALSHLESATETAPGDRAARRLLAEVYAISGNREGAIRLWKTTTTGGDEALSPTLAVPARRVEDTGRAVPGCHSRARRPERSKVIGIERRVRLNREVNRPDSFSLRGR